MLTVTIREMQIKAVMRHHLTLVRMAIINKSARDTHWRGCGEKGPSLTVGGNAHRYNHCGAQYGDSLKD